MKISIWHRHHGVHSHKEDFYIDGELFDYCTHLGCDKYNIDEQRLIDNLPDGIYNYTPKPKHFLLTVANKYGSTGQKGLKKFKNWAKYFDSYILELDTPEVG